MKNVFTALCILVSGAMFAQNDYAVHLGAYENGSMIMSDEIETRFVFVNEGPAHLEVGDSLYVSARINGGYYGLTLLGTQTAIVLTEHMMPGDSLEYDPGALSGPSTMMFFPGDTAIEFCIVVWGIGIDAVDLTPSFPDDTQPDNNTACATWDPDWEDLVDISSAQPAELKLWPNPAQEMVYMQFSTTQGAMLHLISMTGELISSVPVSGNDYLLPVGNLSPGAYIIDILSEDGRHTTQIFNKL